MKRQWLLFALLAVIAVFGCNKKEKKNVFSHEAEMIAFIDDPASFKGKELTFPVIDDGLMDSTLRGDVGSIRKFRGFLFSSAKLKMWIKLPVGLKYPNARYGDDLTIKFLCTKGKHGSGNVATSVTRR